MEIQSIAGGAPAQSGVTGPVAAAATRAAAAARSATAVQTHAAVAQTGPAPSPEQTKQAVDKINATIEAMSQGIEFSIDEKSHNTVVKVIDSQTLEVIRQMPTKEALDIARALGRVQGMLIKQKA
jgi:flagellar protein FlaG